MNVEAMIKALTLEEKAALVAGTDFMYTNPVPRLGLSSIRMSDGPHGLRVQTSGGDNGVTNSLPATCFPPAVTTASSWNPDNGYRIGQAMGREARHYGIDVILGPAVNIKRNPLGGRCFEYFSEDPYLAGKMGTAEANGIQSEGVGVSVKHFALNNSENYRFMGNSIADMRTIREIYLKPFEMIVKCSNPETIMCAYNMINGEYCAQNKWLLTDVLRNEWGFNGLVMTDWGATHDRLAMLRAGLDLEMPGDTPICRKWIVDGLESGELDEAVLDDAVKNVLTLVAKHENKKKEEAYFVLHHRMAKEVAIDSAVLLKNDGMLPLDKNKSYLVCGELFEKPRYQGCGSSLINPAYLSTPRSAFDGAGVNYTYSKGYRENQIKRDDAMIRDAIKVSEKFDDVIVFAGLTDYVESEGFDRADMRLCDNQLALIDALIGTGKRITVVLYGGSPIELPFADAVDAILNMYLPGQNGGEAMYELLFGDANPSGKLAETWPLSYSDVPFWDSFSKGKNEVYKESIFVGYRYYLTANKKVRYPFGYGLSYTKFEYSDLSFEVEDDTYIVSCRVKNVGECDGGEVVQLYVAPPANDVFRPTRELKGFSKVYLRAGESQKAEIRVPKNELRYWNTREDAWVMEGGIYRFEICSDCETVELSTSFEIKGSDVKLPYSEEVLAVYKNASIENITDEAFEKMSGIKIPDEPPKKPIHLESRFSDMKATLMGKILYHCVLMVARFDMFKAKRMPDGVEKDNKIKGAMMLYNILDSNSIISMSMCSSGHFSYNMAQGFAHMANGKIIKGIIKMFDGVKAPALPKEKENK